MELPSDEELVKDFGSGGSEGSVGPDSEEEDGDYEGGSGSDD